MTFDVQTAAACFATGALMYAVGYRARDVVERRRSAKLLRYYREGTDLFMEMDGRRYRLTKEEP